MWVKVRYGDKIGYVARESADKKYIEETPDGKYKVLVRLNLREKPDINSPIITVLSPGTILEKVIEEPEPTFTKDQQLAYEILTKVFKKSDKEAKEIIQKYSGIVTGISRVSRPIAEKILEKILMGDIKGAEDLKNKEKDKELMDLKWLWVGGGVIAGVLLLLVMFKAIKEEK